MKLPAYVRITVFGAITVFSATAVCCAAALAAAPGTAVAEDGIFAELKGAGLDFVHFNGMSGRFYMAEINSGGGALLDYDNDGDLDAYLVQGRMFGDEAIDKAVFPPKHPLPLTDRLYRNDLKVAKDGTRTLRFTDVTEEAGLKPGAYGFGIAAGDYDNDGWVDLYVTRLGSNSLLRNNGDGTFTDVTKAARADDDRWSVPAAFVDFDRDGWLDLYVGNYLRFSFDKHKICRTATGAQDYCGPSAYPGVPDRLLRNRGRGTDKAVTFEDVSAKAGMLREPSKSLGVVTADFNGDGAVDFYVANDLTPNQMWIQLEGGRFSDEALLAGAAVNANGKAEASMGVDAGDFDGDGDDDLFMTHLVRETNTLFLNDGEGMFEDATIETGLGVPSWSHTSWGSAWFDYDNDGWLEMMIANGAVKIIEELANAGDPYPFHETNQLFHNRGVSGKGKVGFEDVTAQAGKVFELSEVSRSVAVGDLDNDGDHDVLLVNNNGPARLLINTVGQDRHWVGLRLLGKDVPRDMLGTRVALIRPGKDPLWRRARSDGSFAAANDPRVLIGLGDAAKGPVEIRAHWPDGSVEQWRDVAIDRYTTLKQGSGRSVP
ncbi:MAG: CRTAC1 family protein [bacterium]|nr:CRTAC1 family protein [bacterium]